MSERPVVPTDNHRQPEEHEQPAEISIHACRALREFSRYDVDAHVVVCASRPRGDEEEHGGIEVPLDLEPRVRAHVEGVAEISRSRAGRSTASNPNQAANLPIHSFAASITDEIAAMRSCRLSMVRERRV